MRAIPGTRIQGYKQRHGDGTVRVAVIVHLIINLILEGLVP